MEKINNQNTRDLNLISSDWFIDGEEYVKIMRYNKDMNYQSIDKKLTKIVQVLDKLSTGQEELQSDMKVIKADIKAMKNTPTMKKELKEQE